MLALLRPAWLPARLPRGAGRLTVVFVGAAVLWQLLQLSTTMRTIYVAPRLAIGLAAVTTAVVIVAELAGSVRFAQGRLPLLVALHFALGWWIIRAQPEPFIDVYVFHVEALRALGQGLDPYGRTIPNIYADEAFYGTGVVVSGRVQVSFPPTNVR